LLVSQCILSSRTVNLNKCKDKVGGLKAKNSSNVESDYTSLIRFFKVHHIRDFILSIQTMLSDLVELNSCYIIVDRTNWKRGTKNINLLTIGGLLENVFAPIMWIQLNKRGNSNFEDRKQLIDRFIQLLKHNAKTPSRRILLADREFIGKDWFEYLRAKELHFVIRLKSNMYFDLCSLTTKKRTPLKSFNKHIERYGIYAIPMALEGTSYTFVMIKNPKYDPNEPYIYFISDLKNAKEISAHYLKRWKIECAFKHLKTNGFNLEDMNLKSDDKIDLMMSVVVFVYTLAIKQGILNQDMIKMKTYANQKKYPQTSIFRLGYSILQNTCHNTAQFLTLIASYFVGKSTYSEKITTFV
jgi:hypothetical protein